jgi:EAL domain-containing protein (putative c-di-GMP-specific phosphodiesterase class I)
MQFGCGGGQGYLFGRPADAGSTLDYLRAAGDLPLVPA